MTRTRPAAVIGTVALSSVLALAALGPAAGIAAADTPPATPNLSLADAPAKVSGKKFGTSSQSWTHDSFTTKFQANVDTVILQVGTSAPTKGADGRYSMGAAQPVVLQAKPATPGSLLGPGGMRSFSRTVTGLVPGRTYHYLLTIPTGAGYQPVQMVASVQTFRHQGHTVTRGSDWIEVSFEGHQSKAWVSLGTSSTVDGTGRGLSGGKTVQVSGTDLSSGPDSRYRFTHRFTDLGVDRTYQLLTAVKSGVFDYDRNLQKVSTKPRTVTVAVERIDVQDDADAGFRGKGELLFQARGTTAPRKSGAWGNAYGETSIGSGQSRTIAAPSRPRHTFTTSADKVTVQVEGREADAVTKSTRKFCESVYAQPGQNHAARWINEEDTGSGCYQFSHAEALVDLPSISKAGGTTVRTIKVGRSPDLRFTAHVRITVS